MFLQKDILLPQILSLSLTSLLRGGRTYPGSKETPGQTWWDSVNALPDMGVPGPLPRPSCATPDWGQSVCCRLPFPPALDLSSHNNTTGLTFLSPYPQAKFHLRLQNHQPMPLFIP